MNQKQLAAARLTLIGQITQAVISKGKGEHYIPICSRFIAGIKYVEYRLGTVYLGCNRAYEGQLSPQTLDDCPLDALVEIAEELAAEVKPVSKEDQEVISYALNSYGHLRAPGIKTYGDFAKRISEVYSLSVAQNAAVFQVLQRHAETVL